MKQRNANDTTMAEQPDARTSGKPELHRGQPHTRKRYKRMGASTFGRAPKTVPTTGGRTALTYRRLHAAWTKRRALHTTCKQTPHTCHEHTCTAGNPSNTEACACALVHCMQVYRYM